MNLLRVFGFGSRKRIEKGARTRGEVTAVQPCWWLKINTKPIRTHMLDGAVVPHIIQFTYSAGGSTRRGSRYVGYRSRCPDVYERITVFYDPKHPADYAVRF